jgi:hypothetical protein
MILSAPLRAASAADMHRLHRTNAPRRRADDPVALARLSQLDLRICDFRIISR